MVVLIHPENAMRQNGKKSKYHLERDDDGHGNRFTVCNQILWANPPASGIEFKPVQTLKLNELCRKCWPFAIVET